jgi:L-serine/L-threonine ammonia-lyase
MSATGEMEEINCSPHVSQPFVKTSLTEVTNLIPMAPPCRVFFKNEYEQPSGSFKLRGIGNLVGKSIALAAKRGIALKNILVLASSGGNAGLAAAFASRHFKVECIVVLPATTKPHIISKLHTYGAQTVMAGRNINEADAYLKTTVMSLHGAKGKHIVYCHPFDNSLIWDGHASLVDELVTQISELDLHHLKSIVCSVGGGGLYNGIFQGVKNNQDKFKHDVNLLLVETNEAPTMTATIRNGEVFILDSVNSIATSLACSYLSPASLSNFHDRSSGIHSFIEGIDDIEAVKSLLAYNEQTGVVVEPACGAALSVVYNQLHLLLKNFELHKDDIVVIVVCGGLCTTLDGIHDFKTWVARQEQKL